MTTMRQRSLTCPNCHTVFEVSVIMSTNVMSRATDFRPVAGGAQPLANLIHTCPSCGMTSSADGFSGKIEQSVRNLIAERLTPIVRDELTVPSRRYEFAAWLAQWRGEPSLQVAHQYLSAAWCCAAGERLSESDTEEYYRRQAIVYFSQALEKGEVGAAERPTITYLIGELYRRVGDSAEAARWLAEAEHSASADPEAAWVAEIARQQATAAQEFF